jgi:flavin-dependent dehydrogenase
VYWGDNSQVVITPVGPREICVAIATQNPKLRLEPAIESIRILSDRLKIPDVIGKEKGALCGLHLLRRVARDRCVTIGDASGSVDSLTGKGVCLAFRQALSLAEAIAQDDISLYESTHRRLMRMPVLMSRLMLMMDSHPGLRRRILRALAANPGMFSRLLAGHVATDCPEGGAPGLLSPGRLMLID